MMYSQRIRLGEVAVRLGQIVKERPGIHFRALGRAAGVTSVGQLRHHIDRLERGGHIVELEEGRFKRFFSSADHEPKLRPVLARFARQVPRQIGKLLLLRPMNRTELQRSLGLADSTLGYHLARMIRLGDLSKNTGRNCCIYTLTDPELVRRIFTLATPNEETAQGGPVPNHAAGPAAPAVPVWTDPAPSFHAEVVASAQAPQPAPGSGMDHVTNARPDAPQTPAT